MIMSILVADLVLLSAAWQLFTFGVGLFALNKAPGVHYCEGCLEPRLESDGVIESDRKIARVARSSIVKSDELSIGSKSGSISQDDRHSRNTVHSVRAASDTSKNDL